MGGRQLSIEERTTIKRLYMRWVPIREIVAATGRSRKYIEQMIRDDGWKEKRIVSTQKIMARLDEAEVDPIVKEIQRSQEIADNLLKGIEAADLSEAKLGVLLREYREYTDRILRMQGLDSQPGVNIHVQGDVVIPEDDLRELAKKAAAEKKRLKGD
jgi:hypothetical protein